MFSFSKVVVVDCFVGMSGCTVFLSVKRERMIDDLDVLSFRQSIPIFLCYSLVSF